MDASLIRGTWQYCNGYDGYRLMEISDSLYYYVDNGDYLGPHTPEGYIISGDTLAWTYDDGTMDMSTMWKIKKLDTSVLVLANKAETIIAKKVKLSLLLSEYDHGKGQEYINQYKTLRKQYFEAAHVDKEQECR